MTKGVENGEPNQQIKKVPLQLERLDKPIAEVQIEKKIADI